MPEDDPREIILAFAAHVGSDEKSPEAVARARGWIDERGAPTKEGHDLIRSLGEQKEQDAEYRLEP